MIQEVKKIFHLLLSVAFSSTGFIAAVTITVLAAREVSSNPYLIGFPNAVGVAGAVIGTQMFDRMSQKYSKNRALSNTFLAAKTVIVTAAINPVEEKATESNK